MIGCDVTLDDRRRREETLADRRRRKETLADRRRREETLADRRRRKETLADRRRREETHAHHRYCLFMLEMLSVIYVQSERRISYRRVGVMTRKMSNRSAANRL